MSRCSTSTPLQQREGNMHSRQSLIDRLAPPTLPLSMILPSIILSSMVLPLRPVLPTSTWTATMATMTSVVPPPLTTAAPPSSPLLLLQRGKLSPSSAGILPPPPPVQSQIQPLQLHPPHLRQAPQSGGRVASFRRVLLISTTSASNRW